MNLVGSSGQPVAHIQRRAMAVPEKHTHTTECTITIISRHAARDTGRNIALDRLVGYSNSCQKLLSDLCLCS